MLNAQALGRVPPLCGEAIGLLGQLPLAPPDRRQPAPERLRPTGKRQTHIDLGRQAVAKGRALGLRAGEAGVERRQFLPSPVELEPLESGEQLERADRGHGPRRPVQPATGEAVPRTAARAANGSGSWAGSSGACVRRRSRAGRSRIASSSSGSLPGR